MSSDLGSWYHSIPKVTRAWFTACIVVPLAARFGLVSGTTLMLNWDFLFYRFNIWRPFTCAVFYPITPMTGFHYLIMLYFLYSYSTRLETGIFAGRPADYVFMLACMWASGVVVALLLGFSILFEVLIMGALYVWCQVNKDQIVSFWFGTTFKAAYFPWVLLVFNFVIRGGGMTELLGIFIGHLYFFLKFKYPQDFGGRAFLETPQFLYKYFPNVRGSVAGFGVAPSSRRQPPADDGAHRWGGGGRRLAD